jgi:hypothetical protein
MEQKNQVARLQQHALAIALRDQGFAVVQIKETGRTGREDDFGKGSKLAVKNGIATKTNQLEHLRQCVTLLGWHALFLWRVRRYGISRGTSNVQTFSGSRRFRGFFHDKSLMIRLTVLVVSFLGEATSAHRSTCRHREFTAVTGCTR